MSAFLVSHRTIDSILSEVPNQHLKTYYQKAIEKLLFGPDDLNYPQEYSFSVKSLKTFIGRELLAENTLAVNDLYPKSPKSLDYANAYKFKDENLGLFQALKSLDCYRYQAMDSDTWPASRAFQLCEVIQKAIIQGHPEYDNAKWGV